MTHISTRNAIPADLPEVRLLIEALASHHADEANVSDQVLERDAFSWYHILIAQVSGTTVGFAALLPLGQLQFGVRGMDLHHLFVQEPWRGQGVGSALIEASLCHARNLNCSYMMVGTHPDNHRAAAFYPKQGFEPRASGGPRFMRRLDT